MRTVLWVLLTSLLVVCGARKATYKWTRPVPTYDHRSVRVSESTVVEADDRRQVMTMMADDLQLHRTHFYRSLSLHDFKTGEVAIKPEGSKYCFLAKVFTTFEETERELIRRSQGSKPRDNRRVLAVTSHKPVKTTKSKMLKKFCRAFLTVKTLPELPDKLFPRFPPVYCIWGPIDIVFNTRSTIPKIQKWKGGFGFFA